MADYVSSSYSQLTPLCLCLCLRTWCEEGKPCLSVSSDSCTNTGQAFVNVFHTFATFILGSVLYLWKSHCASEYNFEIEEKLVSRETFYSMLRNKPPLFLLLQDSRSVIHYQFLSWPDHDVPCEAAGVVDLLERVRDSQRTHTSPLLIHCRYMHKHTHT